MDEGMDQSDELTGGAGAPRGAARALAQPSGRLLNIGAFARRVGLTPSALRFYDDCGVLRPARVDAVTGYRFYAEDQRERALLVRRLREAGLPLVDTAVVLDGDRESARAVLEDHVERVQGMAAAARAAARDILRDLGADGGGGNGESWARVDGAALASAVRQTAAACAGPAPRADHPELGCVLIELADHEVRLVATDRYQLSLRVLRPTAAEGEPVRILVDAEELRALGEWALRREELVLRSDGQTARVTGGGESRDVPVTAGRFPDYRMVLGSLPRTEHRIVVDRAALREAVVRFGESRAVVLRTAEQHMEISAPGPVRSDPVESGAGPGAGRLTLRAVCSGGGPLRIAFDPGVLYAALSAGVGPDVLLEVATAVQPVLVRSADQGSFTTLVMPVRADTGTDG
ncbi:MerR family transcriptional regulator [Streptomyces sp. NPDC046887]|uniref:MerR family transcriptional regulator n=1 Tax=Streptomyces sp. NPDC046887 TaxID=3155472 RepID=UPI003404E699